MSELAKISHQTLQQRMVALMVERFPKCFFPINQPPKPLKVNIKHDLISAFREELKDASFRKDFWIFFRWYLSRKAYHNAIIGENAMRVDLEGNEVMAVKNGHKVYAQQQLDSILEGEKQRKTQTKQRKLK